VIRCHKIRLTRTEGPRGVCGAVELRAEEHENVWAAANALLTRWAWSAPRWGGSHEVQFVIHYTDQVKYRGHYELTRETERGHDLGRHIRQVIASQTGADRPAWASHPLLRWMAGTNMEQARRMSIFADSHEIGTGRAAA